MVQNKNEEAKSMWKIGWQLHLAVIVALLILSFIGAILIGKKADNEERAKFLSLIRTIPYAIDNDQVYFKKLNSPVPAEVDEAREYILRRTTAICNFHSSLRFIYVIGKKDSNYIFLTDTQSKKYSSNRDFDSSLTNYGDIYKDSPAELDRAFEQNKSEVFGPYTDKWGTFITGYIPIKDKDTGEIIAVLGVDIESAKWMPSIIIRYASSFVIGAILIYVYLFFVYYNYKKNLQAKEEDFIIRYNQH